MIRPSAFKLSAAGAELIEPLEEARERERALIADSSDAQMLGLAMHIIEPPIWEPGHVGWFQERWILRNLDQAAPLFPNADSLYDSFNIPNAQRWDLRFPSCRETIEYIDAVLQRTRKRLEGQAPSAQEIYFYRLALYHEDMHTETLHHIRQTLGYPTPMLPGVPPHAPHLPIDPTFEPHDVAAPGGAFCLGATTNIPFVFDNEKWAHAVEVAPFRISATVVTTAEFQKFVEAGGYHDAGLWSAEGWEWRQRSNATHPVYWTRDADGKWLWRRFDTLAPLKPFLPMMHVNWFEANAYCAWAGRRLPTEAEWELAASAEPARDGRGIPSAVLGAGSERKRRYPWGDEPPTRERANLDSAARGVVDVRALAAGDSALGCRQMIGNVWEWTADTFDAYPGFVLDPYAEYSAPSFGQQKVLRGGGWATRGRLI